MKKTYKTPMADVVKFDYTDTVVASGTTGTTTKQSNTKCVTPCGFNPPAPSCDPVIPPCKPTRNSCFFIFSGCWW